ncbi:hypothetical protein SAMN05216410_0016 [Sanguibacter gelidistatuariae]|uniref:Uncharacterized protein n=1 Tax=Sanguibacter gelidistatuariae TaxID=1814289 RepID=A0A1G6WVI1_9MICO|nr:hypothetical protein SAMN05216410_0016 [Sanguibacter gelidistatuariae]
MGTSPLVILHITPADAGQQPQVQHPVPDPGPPQPGSRRPAPAASRDVLTGASSSCHCINGLIH